MTIIQVKIKGISGVTEVEVKDADLKEALEDIRERGVTETRDERTYLYPPHLIEWISFPARR